MILAVDPGGTTGVARWQDAHATFEEIPDGHPGFVWWFEMDVDQSDVTTVVCESFIPRPGARSMQYDALYIIGYVSGWCLLNQVPFKLQSPAQAKSFATNDKLKAAGLYPTGLGHAQDAARHLLTYLAPREQWVQERLKDVL